MLYVIHKRHRNNVALGSTIKIYICIAYIICINQSHVLNGPISENERGLDFNL